MYGTVELFKTAVITILFVDWTQVIGPVVVVVDVIMHEYVEALVNGCPHTAPPACVEVSHVVEAEKAHCPTIAR
jgi:hypothetical protein